MKISVRPAGIVLLFLLGSGCAMLPSNYAKLEPQLEQWQQEDQYGRALDALARIDAKDPDYTAAAKMRQQFEKQAAEYEQQIRKETAEKQQRGEWAAALDQYDEALAKYPKSAVLKDGLVKLHQQQQEKLEELEKSRLISHGQWLREILPIQLKIATIDPRSREAQDSFNQTTIEAHNIAVQLAVIGNKALADNDLKAADHTLPLAAELKNDPAIETSLKTLRSRQKQQQKEQRKIRRKKAQKAKKVRLSKERAVRDAVKGYDAAFAKRDYLTAKKHLSKLESVDRHHKQLPSMKNKLNQAVAKEVERLFESGVNSYSRGQFERAAGNWRTLLQLQPGHLQAKENLDRAEKVLEKLQKLKEKQRN